MNAVQHMTNQPTNMLFCLHLFMSIAVKNALVGFPKVREKGVKMF